jgi:hypothetical protein
MLLDELGAIFGPAGVGWSPVDIRRGKGGFYPLMPIENIGSQIYTNFTNFRGLFYRTMERDMEEGSRSPV